MESICIYAFFISLISHKIRNVLKVFVVMIFARRTLQLITSFVCLNPLDQSKRAFYCVHCKKIDTVDDTENT